MGANGQNGGPIRFGVFEADSTAHTLRKNGARVRIQEKPFRVLAMLLARPGEVVTRDELKHELWPDEEYGEFDLGLNTAVKKVRQALNDSGDSPRWIETVPKVGYKFLAPVEQASAPAALEDAAAETESKRKGRLVFASVALGSALVGLLLGSLTRGPEVATERHLRRFDIPVDRAIDGLVISPDGKRLAYVADNFVVVRSFETESTRTLPATEGASEFGLAWSPDSAYIAFGTESELKRVSVASGEAVVLCEYDKGDYRGATWSPDGRRIIFSAVFRLLQVSASGGAPRVIFESRAHEGVGAMWWPHFLPDTGGPEALVVPAGNQAGGRFWALNLENGDCHPLGETDTAISGAVTTGRQARYSPAGYLVYQAGIHPETGVWALPFDRRTLKATGEAFRIEESGRFASVSHDETLVFLDDSGADRKVLAWRDRDSGEVVGTIGDPQPGMMRPDISPDGRSVAILAREGGPMGLWVHNVERGSRTRVTPVAFYVSSAAWSPTGEEITYWSDKGILRKSADGTGPERVLAPRGADPDWSPDGRHAIFSVEGPSCLSFVEIAIEGEVREPQQFVAEDGASVPEFSPDGRYVAYVSRASGRSEVWIRRFPDGGGRTQVSINGGTQPRWSRDGRELFYVQDAVLMAVPVSRGPELTLGQPRKLFETEDLRSPRARHPQYDVSLDGRRFLMPTPAAPDGETRLIRVVENWDIALRRREQAP